MVQEEYETTLQEKDKIKNLLSDKKIDEVQRKVLLQRLSILEGELKVKSTQSKIPLEIKNKTKESSLKAYSPDTKFFASIKEKGSYITLLNTETNEKFELIDHKDRVTSVVFSPDGRYLLSTSMDGNSIIWELSSREVYKVYVADFAIVGAAFSPDGTTFTTRNILDHYYVWGLDSGFILME